MGYHLLAGSRVARSNRCPSVGNPRSSLYADFDYTQHCLNINIILLVSLYTHSKLSKNSKFYVPTQIIDIYRCIPEIIRIINGQMGVKLYGALLEISEA